MLELFQQPQLLLAVLENMQDGFSIVDEHALQVFVNDALCRMTGFSRAELIGKGPPFPYWPADELKVIEAAFAETLAGAPQSYELTFVRKDGGRLPVIVSPSQLVAEDGRLVAYFATIKDISERKQLERALADSEQRWRSIAENPFDFVSVIDRQYRFTFVNHVAPGLSMEQLIGRATPLDFADPKYHATMREAWETTFTTGRVTSYDVHATQLDAWFSSIVGPIFEDGRVTSASILTRNITAQRRTEEALERSERELREAHKLETVGTLAGGIAHDLNNMLTPIIGFAEIAQQSLTQKHPLQIELGSIVDAATRARDLVQRILLFSRRGEPHKRVLDLRFSVEGDLQLLRGSFPANVQLVSDLPNGKVHVFADATQLSQVLANLTGNAVHAMRAAGGTLRIALRRVTPSGGDAAPHGYAELRVSDTGPGMSEDTRRRAFEPFFTTKPTGAGTGLGLSIVHGIIVDHGGSVTLESVLGRGTVFTVRLPCVAPPLDSATEPLPNSEQRAPLPAARPLRVLCVDDEAPVLVLVRAALSLAGHAVTTRGCPLEALALFKEDPTAFDLIISDQTMPRLKAIELLSEIRASRPELPCLLITGLEDPETEQRASALGVSEIVHKPFSVQELRAAVARAAPV